MDNDSAPVPLRPKLLIVDDTPANITLLVLALADTYEIRAANCGEDALEAVQEELPDLVLLDVNMPGMSGYEVCRRLKASPATRAIPVIFLTGRSEEEDELVGLSLGAVDYVARPHSVPILLARIQTHLELKRTRDLLERSLLETRSAKEEAERATRSKSEFLATTSHEIRTPLGAMIGLSELLLKTPLQDEQRTYASTIRHSGEALLTILNDILDFSKIEAGKLDLDVHPFSLRVLVEEVSLAMADKAQQKGLELLFLVDPALPEQVEGDSGRVRQMLFNLLGNAVKFTPQGHVLCRVAARARAEARLDVLIEVSDTGIGIPGPVQTQLFQSFTQASSATSRKFGGTGLGLTITKRLAELMGGSVAMESLEGRGSTFSVFIPLRCPAPAALTAALPPAGTTLVGFAGTAPMARILETAFASWGVAGSIHQDLASFLEAQAADVQAVPVVDAGDTAQAGELLGRVQALRGREAPLVLLLPLSARRRRREDWGPRVRVVAKPASTVALLDAVLKALGLAPEPPVEVPREIPGQGPWKGRWVLVADDNSANQTLARGVLGGWGIEVAQAFSGADVLAMLDRDVFDAVFLDGRMPELDGFETARRIRQGERPGGPRQLLLGFSASDQTEDRTRCLEAGMDDFVSKPIRAAELEQLLARHWHGTEPARSGPAVGGPARGGPASSDQLPCEPVQGGSAEDGMPRPPEVAAVLACLQRLESVLGGEEAVGGFVDELLTESRRLLETLALGFGTRDRERISRAAHDLKSNASNVGALGTAAHFRCLEEEADAAWERLEALRGQAQAGWDTLAGVLCGYLDGSMGRDG